jgi:hypothetical protein
MTHLLRLLLSWSARRVLIFILLVVTMIAVLKVKEAYDRIPAIQTEVELLQGQQAQLFELVRAERQRATDRLHEAQALEEKLVRQRLASLRQQRTVLEARQRSSAELALDAVSGNGPNIAGALGARFRLQLLRHEEAGLEARLSIIAGEGRANSLAGAIRQLDGRIAQLSTEIGDIERRYPFLVRADRVPFIRDLLGPWQELRDKRQELQQAQSRRAFLLQSQRQAAEMVNRARSALEASRNAVSSAMAPGAELERRSGRGRTRLPNIGRHVPGRRQSPSSDLLCG